MFYPTMNTEEQKETIVIGEVLGAHGQNGALRVRIMTEFPERFDHGAVVYIGNTPYTIATAQLAPETVILRFVGLNDSEVAGKLRGKHLEIPMSERKMLPDGRYYYHDIVGLDVFTNTGNPLGQVSDILNTGSNDVYIVKNGNKEILIPAIKDVVKEIDLAQKRIIIEAIEGILD